MANGKHLRDFVMPTSHIHAAGQGLPTSSWWAKPYESRAAFDAQWAKEKSRIATSSFARAERLIWAPVSKATDEA